MKEKSTTRRGSPLEESEIIIDESTIAEEQEKRFPEPTLEVSNTVEEVEISRPPLPLPARDEACHSDARVLYGNLDFDFLGTENGELYFYARRSNEILHRAAKSLEISFINGLMKISKWFELDSFVIQDPEGEDSLDLKKIYRFLQDESLHFDRLQEDLIRQQGAWIEPDGVLVLNTGKTIIFNNKKVNERAPGHFLYAKKWSKGKEVPFDHKTILKTEDTRHFLEYLSLQSWEERQYGDLLAGWVLLAPFAGMLHWRPHVWIIGPSTAGKSFLLDCLLKLFSAGDFGIDFVGARVTAAGVSRSLDGTSMPGVFEEMEPPKSARKKENFDNIISLALAATQGETRGMQASGDSGTVGYIIRSMFAFLSVKLGLSSEADNNRFSVLSLTTRLINGENEEGKANRFKKAAETALKFDTEYVRSFHKRTVSILPEVLKCVTLFRPIAAKVLKSARYGDQLGTLLAGFYMVDHDVCPTQEQAEEFFNKRADFLTDMVASKKIVGGDEGNAARTFLGQEIEVVFPETDKRKEKREKNTLGYWLWLNRELRMRNNKTSLTERYLPSEYKAIRDVLYKYGLYVYIEDRQINKGTPPLERKEYLQFQKNQPKINKLFGGTIGEIEYGELLRRWDPNIDISKTGRFGGKSEQMLRINLNSILPYEEEEEIEVEDYMVRKGTEGEINEKPREGCRRGE